MTSTSEALFWRRTDRTDGGCWVWTGTRNAKGYGLLRVKGDRGWRTVRAHRFAYELLVGPIGEGLQIDHLCFNKACVNPAHLEPVTGAENVRRAFAREKNGNHYSTRTHCKRGHEFTPENTKLLRSGSRSCRACASMRYRPKEAHQ